MLLCDCRYAIAIAVGAAIFSLSLYLSFISLYVWNFIFNVESKNEHFNWNSRKTNMPTFLIYVINIKGKQILVLFTNNEIKLKMTKQIFFVEYYYYGLLSNITYRCDWNLHCVFNDRKRQKCCFNSRWSERIGVYNTTRTTSHTFMCFCTFYTCVSFDTFHFAFQKFRIRWVTIVHMCVCVRACVRVLCSKELSTNNNYQWFKKHNRI